ncbi:HNH endonuclease signature motif containing protein [Streptomyces sp. NPDC002589]|uniref:HNH endonuclease n=1 Tax=Streptomyces sp. NPDC002589 TaxID=3154420 RepID=UPI0033169AAA
MINNGTTIHRTGGSSATITPRRIEFDNARGRFRRRVQERGSAWCDWCLGDFPADGVDVDHVRPLSLGGEDIDSNVQVLCHGCHQLKRATEFGASAK